MCSSATARSPEGIRRNLCRRGDHQWRRDCEAATPPQVRQGPQYLQSNFSLDRSRQWDFGAAAIFFAARGLPPDQIFVLEREKDPGRGFQAKDHEQDADDFTEGLSC